jgi:CubicO group peptidase (beta-lactamase class C family)
MTNEITNPGIERVLERALELGEVGVQVAAYVGDECIVDTWTGERDDKTAAPVEPDTLFPVFSVGKAFIATAVHLQAERGLLDIDEPIASCWPEYAANGKATITPRHVLTHRACVPHMPPDLTLDHVADWDWIVERLADVEPLSPPGERSMYHSISFGYILGEVIRRTDPQHRPFGQFVRDELCAPFGIDDVWFGLPAHLEPRVAKLTWGAVPPEAPQIAANPIRDLSMPGTITPSPAPYNDERMHAACLPAAGGLMTARDGARFLRLLANGGEIDGKRLIDEARLRACTAPRSNPTQIDEAIGRVAWLGTGGYWIGRDAEYADPVVGSNPAVLAHGGAGGSIGWADIDARLSVMITHNRMFGNLPNDQHPFIELGRAVRELAGA